MPPSLELLIIILQSKGVLTANEISWISAVATGAVDAEKFLASFNTVENAEKMLATISSVNYNTLGDLANDQKTGA